MYGAAWDCHSLQAARATGATIEISTADELSDYSYDFIAMTEATGLNGFFTVGDVPPGLATVTAFFEGEPIGSMQVHVREGANTQVWLAPSTRD